jgi:predicted permease
LLTESLLLALVSAALGYVISRVALRVTIYAVTSTMPADLGDVRLDVAAADWRVVLFLVVGAIASTVFFGLAPALQTTRVELVRAVRGEVTRDARPSRARHSLIAIQVTASALLLICSAIFLRSAFASATVDPGIRTADTIAIDIVNEPLREAMVQAVGDEPLVTAMAASWPDALGRPRVAFAEGDAAVGRATVSYKFVSPEYFSVLDIDVVRGRGFTPAERDPNAAVVIVSETVARQLWPTRDAVGQVLHLEPDPTSETRREDEPKLPVRAFTVVGVARDVAGFRFADFKEAGVYVPTSAAMAETSLTVRIQGHPDQARSALLQRLTAVDPNMGQVITMRTVARMETYFLQIAFWVTLVLGGLALLLTLSGLFSVLSYLVEQRMKEIGVRMALGATTSNVGRLVLLQSVRPVGFGLIAGAGMALGLAVVLLSTPAASFIGTVVQVFDPVAYVASLASIITACVVAALIPALRASRIDPMTALRQE